jgi:hypothetical protein
MKPSLRTAWIAGLMIFIAFAAGAQSSPNRSDQEAQRLVINADGSISYVEPFGSANESLLEYRSKPRPTIDLISYLVNEQRKVEIIDYDSDGKPDFIHIERIDAEGNADMVGLYRGPGHKIHEESHLDHALKHHFIHSDSVAEQQLAERLQAIRARNIHADEIGVFSGYGLFAELRLPSIRIAFESADTLFNEITILTKRTLNNMERIPDIAGPHGTALQLLLSTDPHTLSSEVPVRDQTPQAPVHSEDR